MNGDDTLLDVEFVARNAQVGVILLANETVFEEDIDPISPTIIVGHNTWNQAYHLLNGRRDQHVFLGHCMSPQLDVVVIAEVEFMILDHTRIVFAVRIWELVFCRGEVRLKLGNIPVSAFIFAEKAILTQRRELEFHKTLIWFTKIPRKRNISTPII